jgi:hypothetical protein
MPLRFTGARHLPMGDNTFMWIQVTSYDFTGESDEALLTAMIGSEQYAYDYASPFDGHATHENEAVHGRWFRDRVKPERFRRCSVVEAAEVIRAWSEDGWVEPDYRLPQEALDHLAAVQERFSQGALYRLDNPGEDDEHEYGFVTGAEGFHEFVVIDRAASTLDLIVATDD